MGCYSCRSLKNTEYACLVFFSGLSQLPRLVSVAATFCQLVETAVLALFGLETRKLSAIADDYRNGHYYTFVPEFRYRES